MCVRKINRENSDLGQHVDGKFILPNGLKICWGNATGSGLRSISFPITYTSPPYISVGTLVASEEYSYSTVIVSRSLTGFTFREHWHQLNNNTDGVGQDPCIYFAIGY